MLFLKILQARCLIIAHSEVLIAAACLRFTPCVCTFFQRRAAELADAIECADFSNAPKPLSDVKSFDRLEFGSFFFLRHFVLLQFCFGCDLCTLNPKCLLHRHFSSIIEVKVICVHPLVSPVLRCSLFSLLLFALMPVPVSMQTVQQRPISFFAVTLKTSSIRSHFLTITRRVLH